jgi:hypothetical protein
MVKTSAPHACKFACYELAAHSMIRRNIGWEVAGGLWISRPAAAPFTMNIDCECASGRSPVVALDTLPVMYRLVELAFAVALPWSTVAWLWMYLLR